MGRIGGIIVRIGDTKPPLGTGVAIAGVVGGLATFEELGIAEGGKDGTAVVDGDGDSDGDGERVEGAAMGPLGIEGRAGNPELKGIRDGG